jgi:hypothetical protein
MFANSPAEPPKEDLPASLVAQTAGEADVDIQALAREVLALLKEELRLEKERLGYRLD